MVGALPGDAVMHERPLGRGYVRLRSPPKLHPWHGIAATPLLKSQRTSFTTEYRGWPRTRALPTVWPAVLARVTVSPDGIVVNNLLATYWHFRSAGSYDWAARFAGFVGTARRRAHNPAPALLERVVLTRL